MSFDQDPTESVTLSGADFAMLVDEIRSLKAQLEQQPDSKPSAQVPEDVLNALNRMCQPLHESLLAGATAREDARCMAVIRDYVLNQSQDG